jgi:hypothetical protein
MELPDNPDPLPGEQPHGDGFEECRRSHLAADLLMHSVWTRWRPRGASQLLPDKIYGLLTDLDSTRDAENKAYAIRPNLRDGRARAKAARRRHPRLIRSRGPEPAQPAAQEARKRPNPFAAAAAALQATRTTFGLVVAAGLAAQNLPHGRSAHFVASARREREL